MSKEKFLLNYFWGKLLGSLFGYLVLDNWFGIVLGFVLGFVIDLILAKLDKKWSLWNRFLNLFSNKNKLYRKTLFMNLGYLSKADGVVSPQEIAVAETIFAKLNLKDKSRTQAIEFFQAGKFAENEIRKNLKILQPRFKRDPHLSSDFLNTSLQVCFADKPPSNDQIDKLQNFLSFIGVESLEFERAYQRVLLSQPLDKQTQKTEYDRFKQQSSYNARQQKLQQNSQRVKANQAREQAKEQARNQANADVNLKSQNNQDNQNNKAKKDDFRTIWQNAWDLHKKNQAENKQRQEEEAQKRKARNAQARTDKQTFEQNFKEKSQEREQQREKQREKERENSKRHSGFSGKSGNFGAGAGFGSNAGTNWNANTESKFNKKAFEDAFGFKQGYTRAGAEDKGGLNYKDYHKLMQAYEVLGLDVNASASEIKTTYRKLTSKYHPDKLASQHLSPAVKIAAKQKMQSVQEAYREIRRIKSI